jgi:hypothetical protein
VQSDEILLDEIMKRGDLRAAARSSSALDIGAGFPILAGLYG